MQERKPFQKMHVTVTLMFWGNVESRVYGSKRKNHENSFQLTTV
jgi:hypothetical protein